MSVKWLSSILVFVFVIPTFGQEEKKPDENRAVENKPTVVDPSGTWKWTRDFNGNKIDYTLRLQSKDRKLTGTYQTVFENGGPGMSDPVEIDNGMLEGNALSFTVTRSFNNNEFTVVYKGKLVDGKITGNSELDFGNGKQDFAWNAARTVLADDVVGKWNVKFEGPNGVIESSFSLTQEADKLKGIYHSSFFGDNPMKDIELQDGKLSFVVAFETDNGEIIINYAAEPRGNKLNGMIKSSFGGQEMETPFEGSRVETKKNESKDGAAQG